MLDFLRLFKNDLNDRVYDFEFTQALIASIWEDYSSQIKTRVFLPFLLELVGFNCYCWLLFSQQSEGEGHTTAWDVLSLEFLLRNLLLVLAGFFAFAEYI